MARINKGNNINVFFDGKLIGTSNLPKDITGKATPKGAGQAWIGHQDLLWQSDWNGEEVDHPDVQVVGMYRWRDTGVYVYLNTETLEIIDIWEEKEE